MPWEMPAVAEALLLVGLALGITLANLLSEILVGHNVESALGWEHTPPALLAVGVGQGVDLRFA